jgi:hypothetical protein
MRSLLRRSPHGIGAEIECEVQGRVTIEVLNDNAKMRDMSPDPLWCPFCSAEGDA